MNTFSFINNMLSAALAEGQKTALIALGAFALLQAVIIIILILVRNRETQVMQAASAAPAVAALPLFIPAEEESVFALADVLPAEEEEYETEEEEAGEIIAAMPPIVELESEMYKRSIAAHKTLKLKLDISKITLRRRYSAVRNHLESYQIKERFQKQKDLYYINIPSEEDPEKKVIRPLAIMTIRRKTLVISMILDPGHIETVNAGLPEGKKIENLLLEEKKYSSYPVNIKLANKEDVAAAMQLTDILMAEEGIEKKEKHKEVAYEEQFEDAYTEFERRGFGYVLREGVTFEDAEDINDNFANRAVVIVKLKDQPQKPIKEAKVSLNEIASEFGDGAEITLAELKKKGLAPRNANRLSITDGKRLAKKLYVEADEFTPNAVKMLCLVGGQAYKLTYPEAEKKE